MRFELAGVIGAAGFASGDRVVVGHWHRSPIGPMSDVMWAIATRVRAEKDIVMIPGCKGAILDPTSDPETFTLTKMGIDATRPIGKDFAERLVISDEQRARVRGILESAGVKL